MGLEWDNMDALRLILDVMRTVFLMIIAASCLIRM